MNLEQNNLDTQLSLMNDIIKNDQNIIYHVSEKGKELMSILKKAKFDNNEPIQTRTMSFTNEQFQKLMDIVYVLENESKYDQLGILAKTAVPDNESKKKILAMLRRS